MDPNPKLNPKPTSPPTMWIDKYNPTTIDDLVLDEVIISKLRMIIENRTLQNIIINGPSGTGKTTTINIIVRRILGRHMREAMMELNSYDEKGVKIIHEKLEYFCKKKMDTSGTTIPKIVMLDEADIMTKKTQQTIGYLMEQFPAVRFIFTCNNLDKVIESIQSRCIIFRYTYPDVSSLMRRLTLIAQAEHLDYTSSGLDAIIETSARDVRCAINNLQLVHTSFGHITAENVYKLCGRPHPQIINQILAACIAHDAPHVFRIVEQLCSDGYTGFDITLCIINQLKNGFKMDRALRIEWLEEVTKTHIVINKGIDTRIQLDGCLAKLCLGK